MSATPKSTEVSKARADKSKAKGKLKDKKGKAKEAKDKLKAKEAKDKGKAKVSENAVMLCQAISDCDTLLLST